MRRHSRSILFFIIVILLLIPWRLRAQEGARPGKDEFAGEFSAFGVQVPMGNYYFAKGTLAVFGVKWGTTPQTPQEWEERTWEDLLLSFEAFRRGIKVERSEMEEEITKLLKNEKVTFSWKEDPDAYQKWVKEKTGEPEELFENQLRHLIQLQKLRQQVLDSIKPTVTEEEAHQKFLNEYNTLSLELAQFDNPEDARSFYGKVKKKSGLWGKEAKNNPKLFRRPGFVSLEFLIELWKIPKDNLYKMLELKVGAIYPPAPIYGGKYGVFKVLEKRIADEANFAQQRKYDYQKVEMIKKYEGLNAWIKQLKDEAKIKIYPRPAGGNTEQTKKQG